MMNAEERRIYSRITIDIPVFITVTFDSTHELQVLLADFSKGGIQLILSPGSCDSETLIGAEAVINECQGDLSSLLIEKKGFVCWVSPQRCGIRFYTPLLISENAIHELSEAL